MGYILLLDNENKNVVVKREGRKCYEYIFGLEEWKRVGLLDYYSEESDKYERYKDISDEYAENILSSQRMLITKMWEKFSASEEYYIAQKELCYYKNILEGNDLEQRVVCCLWVLGEKYWKMSDQEKILERVYNTVNCIKGHIDFKSEHDLVCLRTCRNARAISMNYYKYLYDKGKINKEKMEIIRDFLEQKIVFLEDKQKMVLFHS